MDLHEHLRRNFEVPDFEALESVPLKALQSFYQAMGEWIFSDIHGLWCSPDAKDGHSPVEMARSIAERASNLCSLYSDIGTQSPIEEMLAGALLWVNLDWLGFPTASMYGGHKGLLEAHGAEDELAFYIETQVPIGAYKVDFLLWTSFGRKAFGVVVECDGHDFHEKTKEQAARDKKRDREILCAGFPTLRFTGSEIFRSPIECAHQVQEALADARDLASKEARLF